MLKEPVTRYKIPHPIAPGKIDFTQGTIINIIPLSTHVNNSTPKARINTNTDTTAITVAISQFLN